MQRRIIQMVSKALADPISNRLQRVFSVSQLKIDPTSGRSKANGLEPHHQFPIGLIRLHHSMSLVDIFKAKYLRGFRLVSPGGHPVDDVLKRDVREWKIRRTEHEAAKEAPLDSARHL